MKVAVVGGGPSGMMAAYACLQSGHGVTVYDRNPERLSIGTNHGVFALMDTCDLFLTRKKKMQIGLIGAKGKTLEEADQLYSQKVYGQQIPSVSLSAYADRSDVWCYDHSEAYQQIMDILGSDNIKPLEVKKSADLQALKSEADLVICTIPAWVLWPKQVWPSKEAWIYHSSAPADDAFMIYNINEYVPWYRCSAIFGFFSQEFSNRPGSEKKYVRVNKVLTPPKRPEELLPDRNIWFAGRFGQWDKSVITEDVYYSVLSRLSERARGFTPTFLPASV